MGYGLNSQYQAPSEFAPYPRHNMTGNSNEPSSPMYNNMSHEDNELVQLVISLPTEVLEDSLKSNVISLIR